MNCLQWGAGNGEQGTKEHGAAALPRSLFPIPYFPRATRANGFSLLEVIAAILLLAIAFTALMQVAGGSIGLTNNAADYSRAAMWARSVLDTADVMAPLRPGHSEGRFDEQYRWRLNVTPWRPADASQQPSPLQMVKLDLDVLWGKGIRERSAHFSTLRLIGQNGGNPPVVTP